jgi:hypothetical protein
MIYLLAQNVNSVWKCKNEKSYLASHFNLLQVTDAHQEKPGSLYWLV